MLPLNSTSLDAKERAIKKDGETDKRDDLAKVLDSDVILKAVNNIVICVFFSSLITLYLSSPMVHFFSHYCL